MNKETIEKILAYIVAARQICLHSEVQAMENYPEWAVEFERIGKKLDKAIRLFDIFEEKEEKDEL